MCFVSVTGLVALKMSDFVLVTLTCKEFFFVHSYKFERTEFTVPTQAFAWIPEEDVLVSSA